MAEISKEHYFCETWWSHSSTNFLLSASHPKDTPSILWTHFWWQNKHFTLSNSDIRGLLEKYPTVFFYANTWWIII